MTLKGSHSITNTKNTAISTSIAKGVEYLVKNQNDDGSITLNNDSRWQVWETANSILAVHASGTDEKAFLEKAGEFLLNAQREDGSFYHAVSFETDHYCMETTPTALSALAALGKDTAKGVEFMLSKQTPDGSWEIGTPEIIKYRSWPSVSGFVLSTLLCLNVRSDRIAKGIELLRTQQLEDGGWGSKWIYYDSQYYPLHIILRALKLHGLDKSEDYRKAVSLIKNNQKDDGSWCDGDGTDKPKPSTALRTALAVSSLLNSPTRSDSDCIEKGIRWLLREQKAEGRWDGGYFANIQGKKEDIYATTVAIRALKKYENPHGELLSARE